MLIRKYFGHSQERGFPHSVVGLLFSFQRPSAAPGLKPEAPFPNPDRRGVAKTTVLRQGGRLLPPPPRAVKRNNRHKFGSPLGGGRVWEYTRADFRVKPNPGWRKWANGLADSPSYRASAHLPPPARRHDGAIAVGRGGLIPTGRIHGDFLSGSSAQGIQAERSTWSRRDRAASDPTGRPARRPRSASEMATRLASATSSASFTTT